MIAELIDTTGLSPVMGHEDETRLADIVFVHGLGGLSQSTWAAQAKPENFWPCWLGKKYPKVGIWTLGYETSISKWAKESMPLADLGNQILEELYVEEIGSRPVIFITHSMGGLVVKQILSHAMSQGVRRWQRIVQQTRGIVFFSTPHSGSDLASFADFARIVLGTDEQLSELQAHSSRLRELHGTFLNLVHKHHIICRTYAERKEIRPGVQIFGFNVKVPKGILVVDATSNEPNIPGERSIPLNEDHMSICKPANQQAPAYKSVRAFVRECLDTIQPAAPDLSQADPAQSDPSEPDTSAPTTGSNTNQSVPSFQDKQTLVDALLKCPKINSRQTRSMIVKELPFGEHIERNDASRDDIMNIVNGALAYPNGLDALLEIIGPFEGGSIPMNNLTATVRQFQQEFSSNP